MHGVVTVLAEPHYERVKQLWQELKLQFEVGSPRATAVPHFSYHISPEYALDALKQVLLETAVSTPPFTLKTTGIGIFPGEKPVVYLPVTRTPELQALHSTLWPRLQRIAQGSAPESAYYAASNWFPHITLGHSDINADNLGPIITWLNSQSLAWEIQVNNLTLLHDKGDGSPHSPLHRAELQG
jgi:2'-5' RNA ligase